MIGWSAGAWAVQSYFFVHSGLGAIGKAVLYASVPVLLPPGTEDGGTHLSVRPETIGGLLRTYPVNPTVEPPSPNDDRTVAMGLMDFINLCFADETDRAVSSASIQGTMAFNLLTPPQVRLLLGTRWFGERQKVGGPVLATIGLTWRRTARRIKRLKEGVLTISRRLLGSPDPRLFGALHVGLRTCRCSPTPRSRRPGKSRIPQLL